MTKYDRAVSEVRSVLDEWLDPTFTEPVHEALSRAIVERLIAKGVIQSTDLDDLTPVSVRTGPLAPGRTIIGGDALVPEHPAQPGSVQRSEDGSDA